MLTRTVVYWLCGSGYAETLAVSLYSLRLHWPGNVIIAYCPIETANVEAAKRLADTFSCGLVEIPPLPFRRHRHYVTKASLWRFVKSSQVVLIDADTLIVRPIDSLFSDKITVTAFSNWVTTGKKISKRLNSAYTALIESGLRAYPLILDCWPAINTGVIGWSQECQQHLTHWLELCETGHRAPFTDELMMQILLPSIDQLDRLRIVDDRWNCSPTYGRHKDYVAIWHFHGRRHVRKEEGRRIWQPVAREALSEVKGLADWWGKYDPAVATVKA